MKRSLKKLTLHRETIGRLTEERLATVVGDSGATCDPTLQTLCFVCPGSRSYCSLCSECASDCDTCKTVC